MSNKLNEDELEQNVITNKVRIGELLEVSEDLLIGLVTNRVITQANQNKLLREEKQVSNESAADDLIALVRRRKKFGKLAEVLSSEDVQQDLVAQLILNPALTPAKVSTPVSGVKPSKYRDTDNNYMMLKKNDTNYDELDSSVKATLDKANRYKMPGTHYFHIYKTIADFDHANLSQFYKEHHGKLYQSKCTEEIVPKFGDLDKFGGVDKPDLFIMTIKAEGHGETMYNSTGKAFNIYTDIITKFSESKTLTGIPKIFLIHLFPLTEGQTPVLSESTMTGKLGPDIFLIFGKEDKDSYIPEKGSYVLREFIRTLHKHVTTKHIQGIFDNEEWRNIANIQSTLTKDLYLFPSEFQHSRT